MDPDPITAVPPLPFQPYDAAGPPGDDVSGWVKLGGDDFGDGPGPWQQT